MKPTVAKLESAQFNSGYRAVSLLTGIVLLTAAVLKGHQLATGPVPGSGFLDSRWVLIGTVEFELFLGIWLLAGICPRPTWKITLSCFALFTCVSLHKALSGHASCGCFGRVPVNPWYTAALDLTIVLSLLHWRPKRELGTDSVCRSGPTNLWPIPGTWYRQGLPRRAMAVFAIWLSIGLPAAFAMGSYSPAALSDAGDIIGNSEVVVLEPKTWIRKRFPLLDHIDIGAQIAQGEWLVLLYHHDCPKCQEAIQNLKEPGSHADERQVALVEMPPYAKTVRIVSPERPTIAHGHLSSNNEWFASTPITLVLNKGYITNAK